MEHHISDICDNTLLSCQYNKYGCNEKIPRVHYQLHNLDYLQAHNSLFLTFFEEFQRKVMEGEAKLVSSVQECLTKIASSPSIGLQPKSRNSTPSHLKTKRFAENNFEEVMGDEKKKMEEVSDFRESEEKSRLASNLNSFGLIMNENDMVFTSKSQKPRFVFGSFSNRNAIIFNWKIAVKKIVDWVGVGLVNKELTESRNYDMNRNGSFLYAITSHGKIYENKESVQEYFSFKPGDVIDITYNSEESTLVFKKEKLNIMLYGVIPPKQGTQLMACVILNDKGDRVSVSSS